MSGQKLTFYAVAWEKDSIMIIDGGGTHYDIYYIDLVW